MNNKGQSLVTFVLSIPILFVLCMMIYDIGSMVLLKDELNNINYLAMDFGISHMDDDNVISKTKELIHKNKNDIENVSVDIVDNKMYIILEDSINTKISFGNIFNVKSSYVGYIDGDKKIIERNK